MTMRWRDLRLGFLGLCLACLPGLAKAYVTSATLEYSVDDEVGIFVNGKALLARSDFRWADFAVLSTSDGTLPLNVFNMNGDNTLAVENFDTEGGAMGVAYRLTVHQSSGDPIVVWSEPGVTRFKHLRSDQKDPEGWAAPEYNDSAWELAIEGNISKDNQWVRWDCLPDPAFGVFGSMGCVPFISHITSARSNGHDHNLLRSHFKFPNVPAKVRLVVNPPKASSGQNISFRLVPGKDATYFDRYQLFARIPAGLKVTSLSKGGYLDAKTSAAFWDFSAADTGVRYLTVNARAVLQADGWSQPEKVLGPPKAGKVARQLNVPSAVFNDGSKFGPRNPAWFSMQAPVGTPPGSEILGVIFHSQLRLSGQDSFHVNETDPVYFNYSVDGSLRGSLKEDAMVSRTSGGYYWVDGYYDATEDRHWTWSDFSDLRVKFEARQRRLKNTDMMTSVSVVVRYFEPNKVAPYFYASVDDAQCRTIQLAAGIRQAGLPAVGSDPLTLTLNEGLCAPTPAPTSTPMPPPVPVLAIAPTPEPTKAPQLPKEEASVSPGVAIKLGCLENAPEPFKRGGTFVYFCVDKESEIKFLVYNAQSGKLLRSMDAGNFRPGKSQLFFNGLDDQGLSLLPGAYLYEIRAKSEGGTESRNAHFSRIKDR
jgi:hypothetical protein